MRCRRSTSMPKPMRYAQTASFSFANRPAFCRSRSATFFSEGREIMPLLMLRERVVAQREVAGELSLPFELRRKNRLLTKLVDGEAVGLMLERGEILRDGDCLRGDDQRIYRVRAADEDVMDASAD